MGRGLLALFSTLVGLFLILPTVVVVPLGFTDKRSFGFPPDGWSTRWYENFFTDPDWYGAALYSVQVAAIVSVLATTLGLCAAFGLARSTARWTVLLRGVLIAPMIVPGVIVALGLYIVFLRVRLTATTLGIVLAHTVLAIPIVLVTVTPTVQGLDDRLRHAAVSLGATPLQAFRQVTLPLIAPSTLSAALFAFITSFDEAIVSLFLVGPFTQTLPITMWTSISQEADPTVAAASTMLITVTSAGLILAALLRRRKVVHDISD